MQSFSRYRDVIVVVWPWSVHLNAPVLYGIEVKDFRSIVLRVERRGRLLATLQDTELGVGV